jgi:DNA modification methylase
MRKKQIKKVQVDQLAEVLYALPKDAKQAILETTAEYLVEHKQDKQLTLSLLGIDDEQIKPTIYMPIKHEKLEREQQQREGKIHPKNKLNDLHGNAWSFFTKTIIQTSYPSILGHKLRKKHYANKPPMLMRQIIEFFTKRGQTVLDPFAGVGGSLLGASLCNRKVLGIELEQQWIDIYNEVCRQENIKPQEIICGDSLEVLPMLVKKKRQFDAIITDPPYSPALKKTMCDGKYGKSNRKSPFDSFSSSPQDFRNVTSFDEFYDRMEQVGYWFYKLLKQDKYAAVMIRDSFQNGQYIPASFHVAERFCKVGFRFKGVKIWYQTGSPVRPYGYPFAYVPNIIHHTILIFRKEQ